MSAAIELLSLLTADVRNFLTNWNLDKEKKRGWSKSATFTTNGTESASLQVQFPEPDDYTVQFSLQIPSGVNASGLPVYAVKGRAEILWSVEGNDIKRIIDVGNGSSISGRGQAINVKLFNHSEHYGVNPVKQFVASILVTKGLRPNYGGSQPPIYQDVPVLVAFPGPNVDVVIPAEIGANCIYLMTESVPAGVNYSFSNEPVTGGGNSDIFNEWVPIPPGSVSMEFTAIAANYSFTPIYGIKN